MLNQVVLPCAVFLHIRKHLRYGIELMITREDHTFLNTFLTVLVKRFLVFVKHVLLNDRHQRILLQDMLPQIGCGIAVRVLRIACAANLSCAVGSLIERQKVCILAFQLRSHFHFIKINRKIDKKACIPVEAQFLWIAILFPLAHCIGDALSCQLIL